MITCAKLEQPTRMAHYLRNGYKIKTKLDRQRDGRFMTIDKLLKKMGVK